MTGSVGTVFLGSGGFAVPIGEALVAHSSIDLVAVVSGPARHGTRGRIDPPTVAWAAGRELPVLRPERLRSSETIEKLRAMDPGLLVLADYGQIVPAELLDLPRHGALNVHPSLLPRHRGATPVPAAILAGDSETGVSLLLMDVGLDTGPIVARRTYPLAGHETAPELEARLAELGAELLAASLPGWLAGDITPRPQPAEGVNLTRPLRREDGRMDPSLPAARLERQVRAYQPWPGSFIDTAVGRVIVWRARVVDAETSEPGTIVVMPTAAPALATTTGLLELVDVQPAGGKRMSGAELLRGRPTLAGTAVVGRSPADDGA